MERGRARPELAGIAEICYKVLMSTTAARKNRRTAMVPITTMEEVVILSEVERADMIATLRAAEQRIASGDSIEHNSETFVDELMAIRAAAARDKKA